MLKEIPTNIITGFLGVGKTTAIQALLESKPAEERWAVLVNEFGEVGVDAALLGDRGAGESIFVREVPGGCMCCAANLPLQVALNQLLRRARPHRLLIEPTGLGHPEEVLGVLTGAHYTEVLDMQAVIALVDARMVREPRYADHSTFRQQLQVADVVVANKMDLYQGAELDWLRDYLLSIGARAACKATSGGRLQPQWLAKPHTGKTAPASYMDSHDHTPDTAWPELPELPSSGYLRVDNHGEGYASSGWIFDSRHIFCFRRLYTLLSGLAVPRLKGVFITDEGVYGFNRSEDALSCMPLDDALESRMELIDTETTDLAELEPQLLDCLAGQTEGAMQ